MKYKDTIYDFLFDEPAENHAAEKLKIVARRARKISGNWHVLNPYVKTLFKLINDTVNKDTLYQWVEENSIIGE